MVEPLEMINSSPSQQNNHDLSSSQFLETTSIVPYISPENLNPNPKSSISNGPETEEDDKKRDREHKKRSKNWTRVETLKLIKLRTDLEPRFSRSGRKTDLEPRFSRSGRKTELWDEIAEALHKDQFFRDAQQCRDKWEKLMASLKDVREGLKDRSENPYYDDLQPLLAGKCLRREKDLKKEAEFVTRPPEFSGREGFEAAREFSSRVGFEASRDLEDEEDEYMMERMNLKKRKRSGRFISVTDIAAVKTLLEAVISRQQRFFREMLECLERKEQMREQMKQEREDKWREEERAHRNVFNNAMIVMAQKLLGDKGMGFGGGGGGVAGGADVAVATAVAAPSADMANSVGVSVVSAPVGVPRQGGPKKRSKNWKRGEVLQLIKLRGEMDARFANSARRAALWEELAEALGRQGIKRDGKQCREKWDKLMAAYKDVIDGKREEGDLSYFMELKAIVGGRPDEGKLQADIMA
uniref:Myb-like domain-containing protein n=1 Tax=Araucaria cunninghamii TaxID=56994 RepID=A0A0D6QU72_ARACU